jgi:hypothetical protein
LINVRPLAPRQNLLQRSLIAAAVIAGIMAILPVFAAVWTELSGTGAPRTAFASAPAGTYAVLTRSGETTDEIFVLSPGSEPLKIAEVDHLPGYIPVGTVSPDGRKLALVVADAGSQARPGASLLSIDLETGRVTRLTIAVDYLQPPVWTPDSRAVLVTRTVQAESAPTRADLVLVPLDLSGETSIAAVANVAGVYPFAYTPDGLPSFVVVDANGSTLYLGTRTVLISSVGTRDWSLSPDGTQLAFVEIQTAGGLRFVGRTVSLVAGAAQQSVSAASLAPDVQQLGTAWRPGTASPTFGSEPASPSGQGFTAQSLVSGFDVPLAYSPDGDALAVQHWSGSSFDDAGKLELQVVRGSERLPLIGFSRFYGWAAR